MTADHEALLPESLPDWRDVAASVRVVGGKLALWMSPPVMRCGSLLLPDSLQVRPDVGIVVAGCPGSPQVGSPVLAFAMDGCRTQSPMLGGETRSGEIRVYGVFAEFTSEPRTCDWWDSVPAGWSPGDTPIMENITPYADKMLIRKDPLPDRDGIILIPEVVQARTGMATVMRIGPLVTDLVVGDRVCYASELLLDHGIASGDLAVCDDRAILYVEVR